MRLFSVQQFTLNLPMLFLSEHPTQTDHNECNYNHRYKNEAIQHGMVALTMKHLLFLIL